MAELHAYDFDGTLFRSPEPPDWWPEKDGDWFAHPVSLDVPCLPERPGADWWIGSTVAAAKASISNPDVYAICMTGRTEKVFRWRIPELLKHGGLDFDEVHLNPGMSTKAYKSRILYGILNRYPSIDRVELWDNEADKIEFYVRFIESFGFTVVPHLVKVPERFPICGPETKNLITATRRVAARWISRSRG